MKTSTTVALLSLINGIAAYPALKSLYVRGCQPGRLVCQGDGQFGLCNIDSTAFFMNVAAGTKCVCSGSDCTIAALKAGDAPAQPSQATPAPAPTSQAASTQSAPKVSAPNVSAQSSSQQAAPQAPQATSTSQKAAPQATSSSVSLAATPVAPSLPGGAFKETATVTFTSSLAPAATSTATSTATPSQSSAPSPGSGANPGGINIGAGKTYLKTFSGNGDTSAGWPQEGQWGSFDSMWEANLKNVISKSCTNFNNQANNSPAESADLKSAIENVAQSSGVDARFILAVVMQESNGCVRAPTSYNGVVNPGLMQTHNGANSCENVNPCPKDKIQGMIEDGVNGTADGDGLKQLLAKAGGNTATAFYKAARMYNSGSLDASGDLAKGGATPCYASDIANRLLGWSEGVGGCHM